MPKPWRPGLLVARVPRPGCLSLGNPSKIAFAHFGWPSRLARQSKAKRGYPLKNCLSPLRLAFELGKTEQSKAKHSLSTIASREAPVDNCLKQSKAKQSKAKQSKAKQSKAEHKICCLQMLRAKHLWTMSVLLCFALLCAVLLCIA